VAVLTDLLQPWRAAVLAFSVAVTGLFAAAPDRINAQAKAVVVLATTLETPVLEPSVALLTAEPQLEEAVLAGLPTTVARPTGGGGRPTLVVVNGATELGRREPALRRLARGLARAGYVVFIPTCRASHAASSRSAPWTRPWQPPMQPASASAS
jgi:hypothetical protein